MENRFSKPLDAFPTLNADGLRGVDAHIGFARRSAVEASAAGREDEASLWRRAADRWMGKRLDLAAA